MIYGLRKKRILLIVLFISGTTYSQLGDYFVSNNHPKAKGLNFKVKPPIGYNQQEANRPNIVQRWVNSELNTVLILVKFKPKENVASSQKEIENYYKSEQAVQDLIIESGGQAKNIKYFNLDNYPSLYYEYSQKVERLDKEYITYTYSVNAIVEDYMFKLDFSSFSKNEFEKNKDLYRRIANSVIFTDQYN